VQGRRAMKPLIAAAVLVALVGPALAGSPLLARISHRSGCIGPRNLGSFFCDKELIDSGAGSDADRVYLRSA
jgi:hypothetical protein